MTNPLAGLKAVGSKSVGGTHQAALPQAIRQWREQSVAWVRTVDPDAAALLAKRKSTGVPRVVVIGETNRGKSSMVNAMLGMPGLSPVDAGLATCTYLQFSHGTSPTAVAHFAGGMADITFPATELRVWATMDSEPDHDLPPPRWIEVAVPAPLLQTVTVIDTPGVGGLVPGHADLAAEAAAGATALLFVVDASAPFTRGELEFLERVSDRVDAVHFVVTKIDVFRGWREIVAADQQLLARHVPRFSEAQFHPISSTLAAAADGQPDPRIAQMVREQSGVVNLRRILSEDVVTRASLLADANLIRQAVTVIRGDVMGLDSERQALTNGAQRADQLKVRREELLNQRRTGGGRTWQVMLRAEIQRARVDLTHETAREVREASQMFRGAIDTADADQLKQLPFHIDAYAQAMTSRAHGRLLETMNRIVNAVLVELFTAEELAVLAGSLATRPYAPLVTRGPERTRSSDETLMAAMGGLGGFTLGTVIKTSAAAVLPAAFGVALLPATLVLGGAAAFFMVRSRRRVQDKQHLKTWLAEVLGEAKAQIDQNIAEQFIEADEQLTLALDDALTKQVTSIEAEIKQVDGALKLDATERAGRLRAVDERRASGEALVATGEALLERIRSTRPAGSMPVPGSIAAAASAGTRQIALPPGLPSGPGPVARSVPGTDPVAAQQVSAPVTVAKPQPPVAPVAAGALSPSAPSVPAGVTQRTEIASVATPLASTDRLEDTARPPLDDTQEDIGLLEDTAHAVDSHGETTAPPLLEDTEPVPANLSDLLEDTEFPARPVRPAAPIPETTARLEITAPTPTDDGGARGPAAPPATAATPAPATPAPATPIQRAPESTPQPVPAPVAARAPGVPSAGLPPLEAAPPAPAAVRLAPSSPAPAAQVSPAPPPHPAARQQAGSPPAAPPPAAPQRPAPPPAAPSPAGSAPSGPSSAVTRSSAAHPTMPPTMITAAPGVAAKAPLIPVAGALRAVLGADRNVENSHPAPGPTAPGSSAEGGDASAEGSTEPAR